MSKKIEVNKVEIDKVNLWLQVGGIILCLIMGILILLLTDSQDRTQIIAWILIGFAGFKMIGGIDYNKKVKKKKKKYNEKEVSKFAKKIILIIIIIQLINLALFLFLLYSDISNLMVLLIYFPSAIGLTVLAFSIGFFTLLYKNNYDISKIINKLKKKDERR